MKIIKISKNDKLNKVQKLLEEICEELRDKKISSNAFSIKMDVDELVYTLSK